MSVVNKRTQIAAAFRCCKQNLCIAVLLPFLHGCTEAGQERPFSNKTEWFNEARLHLQNENGLIAKDHRPFTGLVYALYPNGKDTAAVSGFAAGKEDGEWRRYFANGQLMERRFYSAGKKVGVYEGWWPNGKRRLLYRFAGGEYEGACTDWDESGRLLSEMNYKAGHEEGPQKQYYGNGKIRANYVVKDGRRYGLLGTKNCANVSDSVFKRF